MSVAGQPARPWKDKLPRPPASPIHLSVAAELTRLTYQFIFKLGLAQLVLPKARTFRLLRAQGQLPQKMFVQFTVGISRFVQWKRARDVDFKRT